MYTYFKLVELFILRTLFNKDEYNYNSKYFNPFKILIIFILLISPIFSIYIYIKLSDVYVIIENYCPNLAKDISKGIKKKDLIENSRKDTFTCKDK